ncbi:restriction endonuclease subunit S [Alkalimonas amylolytica]|uniref:Type I restriction enzyme, S subunit n=1 Tax=Alkalimonas amylolytica TaxID=152573 RepID=A0A1H4E9T6_ALKAM|nr:restriction endonuclease subunit S [Alkalimonas amylolytica]SEA81350.1 type I restriction enzyme, S subunit [Alkalimonas amylolytica]
MIPNYSGSLRYFGRIKNGTTPASGEAEYWDGDVRWATPEDLGKLVGDRIALTKRQVTEKAVIENNLNILPVGSVLISTRAPIGHMAITAEPMTFNQGCRGIIPNERVDGAFLYYLLKSRVPELNAVANGTTFVELSRDELAAIQVSFPPLKTQRRIAQFLDEKTARIDGLIEKKRALLDRLAEKRQALITQAVTKGLNPDAPMKPSGIDWLGNIPAHWEVLPVKRVSKLESGHTPDKKIDAYWDDCQIPWVSLNDTAVLRASDYISDTTFKINELGLANSSARLLPARAVVFTRDATIGESAITTRPMAVSQHIIAWLCHEDRVIPEYLLFTIYGMTGELLRLTNGSTIGTIGLGDVKSIRMALPPIVEQRDIVSEIVYAKNKIDEVTEKAKQSIQRLHEYRSAVITAAVTGQIGGLQ